MRHSKNRFLVCIFVLALVSPIQAQSHSSEISGLNIGGIPHPVSAALAYWDSLNLSEAQIAQLRAISDEFESKVFSVMARAAADTAALWILWKREPFDSLALVNEARSKVDSDISVTLAMLRARDQVFNVLTSSQLVQLQALVRARLSPSSPRSSSGDCRRGGGSAGSTRISDRVELVYSVSFNGDSTYIHTVFVVRADDKLYSNLRRVEQPVVQGKSLALSGATSGRWWLQYDKREKRAWLHDQRIDLGANNVVLVQGTDRLNRPPEVVGLATVRSPIVIGGCELDRLGDVIKEHLMQVPEIRAFIVGAK